MTRNNVIQSLIRDVMMMLPHDEVKDMRVSLSLETGELHILWNNGLIVFTKPVLEAMESDPLSTVKQLAKTLLASDET